MNHGTPVSDTASCRDCLGANQGLCCHLPVELRTRLREVGRLVEYPANHCFWNEDSASGFIGLVHEGHLRMLRYSAEGRRQIMLLVHPAEIIGEGVETRTGYNLEAATPVRLCRIERPAFDRLMQSYPQLGRAVSRQCVERLDRLRRSIWSLGLQTPEERLCGFLADATRVMPFAAAGRGGTLTMPLPRADIADYLGTTRETISRLTYKLLADGLIVIHDARSFHIPDLARLRRAGALTTPVPAARATHPGEPVPARG